MDTKERLATRHGVPCESCRAGYVTIFVYTEDKTISAEMKCKTCNENFTYIQLEPITEPLHNFYQKVLQKWRWSIYEKTTR